MSDDPGRDLIMRAAEEGLLTRADAESVDAWASELATQFTLGLIDEAEVARQLRARLLADVARRGRA